MVNTGLSVEIACYHHNNKHNNIADVKVDHNHLKSNNLPAGDQLEWGDKMCSEQLHPEVKWDRKLQIVLNTQT